MESIGQAIAIVLALLAAFGAAVWAAAFVWAWQDIRRRTQDIYVRLFAPLLVLVLGPLGALLYMLLRPAETLDEAHLRQLQEETLLQDMEAASPGPQLHAANGVLPTIGRNVFVAPGVQLIGDVRIEDDASVWYNTVIRADLAPVNIGPGTNIQDGCVLHVDAGLPLVIGADVTVGHMAVIHACTIEDECLIGIQSTDPQRRPHPAPLHRWRRRPGRRGQGVHRAPPPPGSSLPAPYAPPPTPKSAT